MSAPRLAFPAPWSAESVTMGHSKRKATLTSRGTIMTHVEAVRAHNDLHFFTLRLCEELTRIDFDCSSPNEDLLALAREYEEASR